MVLIRCSLLTPLCCAFLAACAPKKVGADTHIWSVTAQNGDIMTGCLAEDVTPDVFGYIDISALPNFDIATFEDFKFGVDDYIAWKKENPRIKRPTYRSLLNMTRSRSGHPVPGMKLPDKEAKVKHCSAYPPPAGTEEWYLSLQTSEEAVQYRFFSRGDKMVFIDARTRVLGNK